MKYKNPKHIIYSPLVLAFVLLAGILLGVLIKGTKVQEKLVVFPQQNKLNYVLDLIEKRYVDPVSQKDLIEKAIPVILKELDPHSVYIPASEFQDVQEPLNGNFDGIGVQFNMHEDTVLVINVINGGPSSKVGLLPGDRIVEIDDSVFVGPKISSQDVIKHLKGPGGTKVKVGISRRGTNELLEFEIERGKIPIYSVDVSYMVTKDIGYIKISRFARTTYKEFLKGVLELQKLGMKKLIVDLRSNSGGYLDAATNIADEFLANGKMIVYTKGANDLESSYKATSKGNCHNTQVAVLIDMYSASASEIFAGAIQDHDAGVVIGQRSYGKGLVQEPVFFKDSSAIRLTVSRYYTPSGRCIQKPYDHGNRDYYSDLYKRMANGEFLEKDSTHFNDSLSYRTSKGRIVYGGGGVMPDYFIPVDTTGVGEFFTNVVRKGLIYHFALDYSDVNRERLSKLKNYKHFKTDFETHRTFDSFLEYAKQKGIKSNNEDIQKSEVEIKVRLMAYISRNIIDNLGFYPIINEPDSAYKKAIQVLEEGIHF